MGSTVPVIPRDNLVSRSRRCFSRFVFAVVLVILNITSLLAQAGESDSTYDKIWSYAVLYDQPDANFFQKFALTGRAQYEYVYADAEQGDFEDSLWRRFRFGAKIDFADDWRFHLEADFDLEFEEEAGGDRQGQGRYNRLTDAYLAWDLHDDWQLKLLKQSAGFTLDGYTSSKSLLTSERNNLTNNLWFTAEYFTGITASGNCGTLSCKGGVFSSDGSDELSEFNAGYFSLLNVSHDLGEMLNQEALKLSAFYVYNDRDDAASTPEYSNIVSLVAQWQDGPWGLSTDLSHGWGYAEQSDVLGLVAMPYYNFSEHWQLVLRYTWLRSDEDAGVRFGRYEREIVGIRGDRYREFFAGVNWYLYGHKLKWQTGFKESRMDDAANAGGDYDGWEIVSGIRLSW